MARDPSYYGNAMVGVNRGPSRADVGHMHARGAGQTAVAGAPEDAAAEARPTDRVKVLYILGWGRSGSTIMDNLLGELDGFFSAGELNYLWQRGLVEGRKCGCGRPVRACPVWSGVLRRAFGDDWEARIDPREVVRWQREAVRVRHTPAMLRLQPGEPTGRPALDAYLGVLARLYRAIPEETGARVVVDSSKRPSDAALLRLVPGVRPSYVQLVRDPRAVAYSWQRHKAQPDRNRPAELVRHGPVDSTLSWIRWNSLAESVRAKSPPSSSLLLRYEDLVARPRPSLLDVAALVGEAPPALPLEGERTALLEPNHTVSGNPSRFRTGRVELRADDEWITRQSPAQRSMVTSLALPLLSRYGYPLRVGTPQEST